MASTPTSPPAHDHLRAVKALTRASGAMSTAITARMETDLAWFSDLGAENRSWVGLIASAGIGNFIDWYAAVPSPSTSTGTDHTDQAIASVVFGAAPRRLAGVITLQQTVDLVRLTIEAVEDNLDEYLDAADVSAVRGAVLRYGREVAFATAEIYARAAEVRGAWDARLEALVVDSVLRGETDTDVLSRANAVGWHALTGVVVLLGSAGSAKREADLVDDVRHTAEERGLDALCAVQGDRLVVILGGVDDPLADATAMVELFSSGPVVIGPMVEDLTEANTSARDALAAYLAAAGWAEAPRLVLSADLMPERVLTGDAAARRSLIRDVYLPIAGSRQETIATLSAYLESGSSLEATARALFVHPNTVRYRLRTVEELTGLTPTNPREALTLRLALILGRLEGAATEKDL
ncbi:fatty acid biosynthesis transcriptional regulator FasR [Nocardioides salsibiostraticola]